MRGLKHIDLKWNEKMALRELKEKLLEKFPDVEITLYGSKARGDDKEFSDIDLLILVKHQLTRKSKEKITEIRYDIELKYNVVFGILIESADFWCSPLANAMPLHWSIDKEGVYV